MPKYKVSYKTRNGGAGTKALVDVEHVFLTVADISTYRMTMTADSTSFFDIAGFFRDLEPALMPAIQSGVDLSIFHIQPRSYQPAFDTVFYLEVIK